MANHVIYITDYVFSENGLNEEIDWFSSMSRVIAGGDCEDSAKEIIMLCVDLQYGTWTEGTLAWHAADALRHYVCTMALGSVRGPRLGQHEKKFLAHAYVLLIPRVALENLIDKKTLRVTVPESTSVLAEGQPPLRPLTLDGTNLKAVEDDHKPSMHPGRGGDAIKNALELMRPGSLNHFKDRFKVYAETANFYCHIVSLLTSSVISIPITGLKETNV